MTTGQHNLLLHRFQRTLLAIAGSAEEQADADCHFIRLKHTAGVPMKHSVVAVHTFFKDCSKNLSAPMRSPALYFSCPFVMHSAACMACVQVAALPQAGLSASTCFPSNLDRCNDKGQKRKAYCLDKRGS